jgi:hypothetical protein
MPRRFVVVAALAALLLLLGHTPSTTAGKPAQMTFEELVRRADFVGLVECEASGVLVAKYKVIASWRGPKAGERLTIGSDVYYFAKGRVAMGLPLCGQRYLFAAARARDDEKSKSPSRAKHGPLSWRQIPVDFQVGWAYGRWHDPEGTRFQQAKQFVRKEPEAPAPPRQPKPDPVWQAPKLPAPPRAQLAAWRAQLAQKEGKDRDQTARDGLLMYEPSALLPELLNWTRAEVKKPSDDPAYAAYWLASSFAWKCGQDRPKHLKQLLTAKEPAIRVAGAVYLCFEDETLGLKELAKLTDLEGEAGAWAALTLARRGRKSAVPRVLALFKDPVGEQVGPNRARVGHWQWYLRLRAVALLSNSAHKSGVAFPKVTADTTGNFDLLQQWWQQNAARVTLHDPWLAFLARQKID